MTKYKREKKNETQTGKAFTVRQSPLILYLGSTDSLRLLQRQREAEQAQLTHGQAHPSQPAIREKQ